MTVAQVKARCRVVQDSVPDNPFEERYRRGMLVMLGRDTVLARVLADSVSRIEVTTPHLRTRDSLGVGTRLIALLRRRGAFGGTSETSTSVDVAAHCGISFELSTVRGADGEEFTAKEMLSWSPDITVTAVVILGCRH
ncbi:MAG TPA: hypothetical protein VMD08_08770 [Candidatus Baltobacteraceae bacterium]|nr:hypothetical protein [Candidatus Baltobacteraceae bacterium]